VIDEIFFDEFVNINSIKSTIENYGLSAGFRLTDRFSIGVTVKNVKLDLRVEDIWQQDFFNDIENVLLENFNPNVSLEEYLAVFDDHYDFRNTIDDSDRDTTFDVGVLFKSEKWSFGAVYHQGAKFKVNTTSSTTGTFECLGDPEENTLVEDCELLDFILQATWESDGFEGNWRQILYPNNTEEIELEFNIPDRFSFGLAWRPVQTFLVSVDINRIAYSDLKGPAQFTKGRGFDLNDVSARVLFSDTDGSLADNPFPFVDEINDETVFSLGVEKFFTFQSGILRTIALRGGAFNVKDHDGNALTDTDETVWTVGLGSTWGAYGGDKAFQLDIAASFADDTTNVILSGIFRF